MAPAMDLFALIAAAWASVIQGQLPNPEILKMLVSKALGYGVVAGACITKVPQIQVVLRNRSAQGLAFLSFEMEALCLLIHTSYGYLRGLPFNAYGEAVALLLQTLILLVLIYRYGKASTTRVTVVVAAFVGLVGVVLSGQLTEAQIQGAFSANTLIFMAARLPQIWTNFKSGSTGQLSSVTCLINLMGCIVRIFTTIQEEAGAAMLRQYLIALLLNSTIVAQILFYRKGTKKSPKGNKATHTSAKTAPETKKGK